MPRVSPPWNRRDWANRNLPIPIRLRHATNEVDRLTAMVDQLAEGEAEIFEEYQDAECRLEREIRQRDAELRELKAELCEMDAKLLEYAPFATGRPKTEETLTELGKQNSELREALTIAVEEAKKSAAEAAAMKAERDAAVKKAKEAEAIAAAMKVKRDEAEEDAK